MSILNLTYSRPVSTYVSPPIAAMQQTLEAQEEKFYRNLDTKNKLEIALSQLKVEDENAELKNAAIDQFNTAMADITETGDWENAGLAVRGAAQDIATNSGLTAAVASYQKRQAEEAALKEKVGKPADEGGITMDDYIREVSIARQRKGVAYNEETGTWDEQYSLYTPPPYEDRGSFIDNWIDDEWKSDQTFGGITKVGPNDYRRTVVRTLEDGTKNYFVTTEKATFKEIYNAARTQVMQNQNMKSRINYEMMREGFNYDQYVERGINRDTMIAQLNRLEINGLGDLSSMGNEELAKLYHRETKLFTDISGSVEKAAYMSEDLEIIGDTMAVMLHKSASKNGLSDDAILSRTRAQMYVTEGYGSPSVPADPKKYDEIFSTFDNVVSTTQDAINRNMAKIAELKKDPEANEKEINRIRYQVLNQQEAIQRAEVQKQQYGKYLQKALQAANEEFGLSVSLEEFGERVAYEESDAAARMKALVKQDLLDFPRGSATKVHVLGNKAFTKRVQWLHDDGKISDEDFDEYMKYSEMAGKHGTFQTDQDRQKYMKIVADNMKKQSENISISYGYTTLGVDQAGRQTPWSARETKNFHDNSENYYLIDKDTGEAVAFGGEDTDLQINPKSVTIDGFTNQFVDGHGYCLTGYYDEPFEGDRSGLSEKERNEQRTRRKVLIKPPDMNFVHGAFIELRRANIIEQNKLKEGYDAEGISDVERAIQHTEIDRELAWFNTMPPLTPQDVNSDEDLNTIESKVNVSPRYVASVRRHVDRSGNITWEADLQDRVTEKVVDSESYATYYQLEFDLERVADIGYKVPLSYLERINDFTFTYGQIKADKNATMVTYLHPEFLKAAKKLDNDMKLPYVITDMMRSMKKNAEMIEQGAAEDSYHMYGAGMDIRYNDEVNGWLEMNSAPLKDSSYRKIAGHNLKYLIHGADKHIHLEFTEVPQNVIEYSNASFWLNPK